MSRLGRNIRKFSAKASEVSQALQAAPQKIAQFRESVALTTDQLQQLRNEVQSGLKGLMVTPDQLAQVAGEINESQPVLEEAGYELAAVEVEYGHTQKIIVRLEEYEEVAQAKLRSLLLANQSRRTTSALLSAIIKAKDVAGKIEFANLPYTGLDVHLGATAAVRVCWAAEVPREEEALEPASTPAPPLVNQPASVPKVEKADAPLPNFGIGGFFEARASSVSNSPAQASVSVPAEPLIAQVPAALPAAPAPAPASPPPITDWRRDALERFKKMPGVSKYGR